MRGVLGASCPAKPGSSYRGAFAVNAGNRFAHQGRRCSLSSLHNARQAAAARAGGQGASQGRLPPPQAASQLSQAELEELLAENAKLKQLISTVKDRLPPEKVAQLQKQYEEIAALAAAAGLQLEDPLSGSPPPKKQQQGAAAAPATDAAGTAPAAAAAPAKGPQPKAIEVAEGDRKVKAWVLDKGDVVSFSFDGGAQPKRAAAAAASAKPAAAKPQTPAAAGPAATSTQSAAPPAAKQQPAAAPAAPAPAKAAAAPAAAGGANKGPASAAPAASDPVAAFIQATKAKATAPKPAPAPAAPPPPAAAAAPAAPSSNGAAAAAAAPAAAADGGDSRASRWSKMADEAQAKKQQASAAAAAPAAAKPPAAAPPAAAPPAAAPAARPPPAAAAPAAAAPAAAPPAAKQPAPAAPAPAQPKAPAAAAPAAPAAAAPAAAAPPAAAAAAPAGLRPPPPPAARGGFMPPPPPAAKLQPNLHQPQARPAQPQDMTGPTPTSPLFSGSSSSSSAPSSSKAPSSSPPSSSSSSSRGPSTTALVDVGPPKPPKMEVEDILDIPDPVEQAVKSVASITPEERARRAAVRVKEREAAQQLLQAHDPVKAAATRHGWLMFTVPEKPVAGCDCIVYYNRTQSETLRERNRIQLILGYNQWEMQAEQGKVDLYPSSIPHIDGSDFWCCRFKVPESAFEVNFVLTDGEQLFDNNSGQDFTYPTAAGITWEEWQAAALERQAEQEKERQAAEEARRAEELKREKEDKEKRDRELALKRVSELRDGYASLVDGAVTRRKIDSTDPTSKTYWYVTPRPPVIGGKATLLYNSKAGPLKWIEDKRKNKDKSEATPVEGQQIPKVLLGFNNWKVKLDPKEMKHSSIQGDEDEVWWEASFEIPKGAVAVNFVVNCENAWDNNGGKDHKIAVDLPKPHTPATVGEWAEEMLPDFIKQEREMRLAAEKVAAEKEAKRSKLRNIAKEKAKLVLRRQMKHVMFTEPEVIQAGERVTVYYNPDDTILAGSSQLWFTGGFNRWNHKRSLGPVKMRPPGPNGKHWQVRFSVPKEAVQLDFVFSNVQSGEGIYDNRGGFDYHLPIEGGTGSISQRLHVAHIAVEMAPVAKVGGLGDVVTALARAVQEEGHLVEVILPRYDFFLQSPVLAGQMRYECEFDWGGTRIFVSTAIVEGLRCFFIEPRNGFFQTPTVYGRYDDEVRFDFFCKAALEFLLKTGRQPDILHCHDWSTAHVAKSFWEDYQPYGLYKPKVVFTIHNMNYGQKKITEAAEWSQKFTTVSPTYAFEIGGHPAIAGNTAKFMGIRNGIDTEIWSPFENKYLPMSYDADTLEEGKRRAREEVRKRVNMSQWQDKPIVAVVSRLTPQKGVHLIKHAAYKAIERGCQFVLLGSAPDPKVQAEFDELSNELGHGHNQDAGFVFGYDEPLSHMIYAAADIMLVPSMFEPCGLTQMIAMRYGAVPVVRHTGGLRDTVFDVDNDKPRAAWEVAGSSDWMRDKCDETNGFAFEGMDEGGLDYALNRAIDAYYNDKPWFRSLQARIMRQDWSWNRPALDYVELYYSTTKS